MFVCSSLYVIMDLDSVSIKYKCCVCDLQWLMPVHCTSLPEHTPNAAKYLSHPDLNSIYIFLSKFSVHSCLSFLKINQFLGERENVKSIGERGSRHVSDFHPWHQWSSLNSSTQHNPQPVGKCEKLHKVIYTLMSIFPKYSNGMQFKDNITTFFSFSNIIPRGLY